MRTSHVLALTFALLTVAGTTPAFANGWSFESFKTQSGKADWEGFGIGTSVTKKSKSVSPRGSQETEERTTLIKIEDDKLTFKIEKKGADGKWAEQPVRVEKRKKDVKIVSKVSGEETITVAGTSYPCKILNATKTEDGKSEPARFWVHEEKGILKMEMESGPGMKLTFVVTKIDVEKAIGKTIFKNCREYSTSFTGGTMRMVLCLNCPESTLVKSMEMEQGGMKFTEDEVITAVTIKKKKAAAATPTK